jgi:hypothetical protein
VAGVPVGILECGISASSYYSCSKGIEDQLRQRGQILKKMRDYRPKPEEEKELIGGWKSVLNIYLVQLYATQQAITTISKGYFDGCRILFPDAVKVMAESIEGTEDIVERFNRFFADTVELSEHIDLETLRRSAREEAAHQIEYIADQAKAEALDALGEQQAAIKLAARYL